MVRDGHATTFHEACSILGRHGAARRSANRRKAVRYQRAQTMWWQK